MSREFALYVNQLHLNYPETIEKVDGYTCFKSLKYGDEIVDSIFDRLEKREKKKFIFSLMESESNRFAVYIITNVWEKCFTMKYLLMSPFELVMYCIKNNYFHPSINDWYHISNIPELVDYYIEELKINPEFVFFAACVDMSLLRKYDRYEESYGEMSEAYNNLSDVEVFKYKLDKGWISMNKYIHAYTSLAVTKYIVEELGIPLMELYLSYSSDLEKAKYYYSLGLITTFETVYNFAIENVDIAKFFFEECKFPFDYHNENVSSLNDFYNSASFDALVYLKDKFGVYSNFGVNIGNRFANFSFDVQKFAIKCCGYKMNLPLSNGGTADYVNHRLRAYLENE